MGRNITTDQVAASGGGGGIAPPKAIKGIIANPQYGGRLAHQRPMKVVNEGEYLVYSVETAAIEHRDKAGALNWSVLPTALTSMNKWLCINWDTVDNKLYVLATNTGCTSLQFASIAPATGAVTLIGAAWTPTAGLVSTSGNIVDSYSMARIGGEGSGDMLVSISQIAGMASMQIPITGGSATEVLNIQVGGADPKMKAAYKVATDLYIGNIAIQDGELQYTGSTSYASIPNQSLNIVTPNVQVKGLATDNKFGVSGSYGATPTRVTYVNEWGGGVIICSPSIYDVRTGATLYDKADFARWAKDIANKHCGGTF